MDSMELTFLFQWHANILYPILLFTMYNKARSNAANIILNLMPFLKFINQRI